MVLDLFSGRKSGNMTGGKLVPVVKLVLKPCMSTMSNIVIDGYFIKF